MKTLNRMDRNFSFAPSLLTDLHEKWTCLLVGNDRPDIHLERVVPLQHTSICQRTETHSSILPPSARECGGLRHFL